jgi:hypothetical protein
MSVFGQPEPAPTFGEPESEAWALVLAAIEEAMDVAELLPFDRAKLAELHEQAAWHIGEKALRVPTAWEPPSDHAIASGPLGTYRLRDFGVDGDAAFALVYTGNLLRVGEVEEASDEQLMRLGGIGPRRLRRIRDAVTHFNSALVDEATGATSLEEVT